MIDPDPRRGYPTLTSTRPGALVQVIDTVGIEQRGAPLDPMLLVALREQEFGQERAVLSRNAGDQCNFTLPIASARISSNRLHYKRGHRPGERGKP